MTLVLVALSGAAIVLGLAMPVIASWPSHARLSDALNLLDPTLNAEPPKQTLAPDSNIERAGSWMYRRLHLPLRESTVQQLALSGRSIPDFFAEKLVWVTAGFTIPLLGSLVGWILDQTFEVWPAYVSLIGAAVGYFIPNLRLRNEKTDTFATAAEALFMFFDLVALERLANRSITQALRSVASTSMLPLFVRIRTVLDRSQLEQVAPWNELRKLAQELDLPVLADMADVCKLDEQGASLAEPLRVRVRELRDAHLSQSRQAAHAKTERMTLWMTLPTIIFGLIFLAAPLLRLTAS